MIKLLLDENISPSVAVALAQDGVDAIHIRDRGMLSATDAEVLEKAFADDRVLVTKNVDDFVALARARDLHAGIVLIEEGDLLRDEQLEVIRRALEYMEGLDDMVNKALTVRLGGTFQVEIVALP